MFTNAIVRPPCPNMIHGISDSRLGQPDYHLALRQHQDYVAALSACGLTAMALEPDDNFPDSVFIEDTCLVTPRCAVITNPGALSRKGEIHSVEAAIRNLDLPVHRILAPGTLDAGDVMMVSDHYYVGLSGRTNADGAAQLGRHLADYGYAVTMVALDAVLHLKTGISYLENNYLLATGEFLTKPELTRFKILAVDPDEAYAANSVWVNGTVLVPGGFKKTRQIIESLGYETLAIDVSEFRKLDGGLSCLSLRF